jgi:hypothetical protein
MYWIHDEKENLKRLCLKQLRREGFPEQSISRLYQLRSDYAQDALDQPALDTHHLEFVRWLVKTGRLTDEFH